VNVPASALERSPFSISIELYRVDILRLYTQPRRREGIRSNHLDEAWTDAGHVPFSQLQAGKLQQHVEQHIQSGLLAYQDEPTSGQRKFKLAVITAAGHAILQQHHMHATMPMVATNQTIHTLVASSAHAVPTCASPSSKISKPQLIANLRQILPVDDFALPIAEACAMYSKIYDEQFANHAECGTERFARQHPQEFEVVDREAHEEPGLHSVVLIGRRKQV
jgi:hypothetical protein